MAYHFSANQFNDKYSPRKLGNWEYPKWYPDRPRQRFKSTKIIADDQGRLLEGVKRENPWGNYVGTWELPRRITREYVRKLVAPRERLVKLWEKQEEAKPEVRTKCEGSRKADKVQESPAKGLPSLRECTSSEKNFERRNKSSSALDLRPPARKLEPLTKKEEESPSITRTPTSYDEKIEKILKSVEAKPKTDSQEYCKETSLIPRHSKEKIDLTKGFPLNERPTECEGYLKTLEEFKDRYEEVNDEVKDEPSANVMAPVVATSVEQQTPSRVHQDMEESKTPPKSIPLPIAKQYHEENLRHKPLPDVVDDPVYKALISGGHPHPGGSLSVQATPSAIGWKTCSVPGPTECSKMNVYRPKTTGARVKVQREERPKTGGGNDQVKKKWLPIDLAICWDLKLDETSGEPKRPSHIDGSNGSAAPAVFTMIRAREAGDDADISESCQAVAERITKGIADNNLANVPSQGSRKGSITSHCNVNREAIMAYVREPSSKAKSDQTNNTNSTNSISPNAAEYVRRNPKTAWSNEEASEVLSHKLLHLQKEKTKQQREPWGSCRIGEQKFNQSTPNLAAASETNKNGSANLSSQSSQSFNNKNKLENDLKTDDPIKITLKGRNCSACERGLAGRRDREEFKAAFKAGVPKSESSGSGSTNAGRSYKPPKMRLPYAKKNYSIGTLVPPFSFWPESKGQEYPEHWRLASVYQHSYKPINTRKRPMLASVYQ